MAFQLPDLPYAHDALGPYMSKETLEYHHDKHHLAYVNNGNNLLKGTEWENKSLEEIVKGSFGKNASLFNNAGQHYNHLHFWKWMKPNGGGAIINIGGLTGYTGAKNRAHVVSAKSGLDGLTKALAHELAEHAITANLVSPGLIDTVRGRHTAVSPDHHKRHATLLGRRGKPEEVARLALFLASDESSYSTGSEFTIDGGMLAGTINPYAMPTYD